MYSLMQKTKLKKPKKHGHKKIKKPKKRVMYALYHAYASGMKRRAMMVSFYNEYFQAF